MKRQPSAAAASKATSPGRATQLRSATGTMTRSANDPQALKPGWWSTSQIWVWPARHGSQRPHPQQNGAVTRSPTRTRDPGPTSATTPANSWPGTCGSRIAASWPIQPCQSLRHRPVARTSMTAPSGGHAGAGTSSTLSGSPNARRTAARMAGSGRGALELEHVERPELARRPDRARPCGAGRGRRVKSALFTQAWKSSSERQRVSTRQTSRSSLGRSSSKASKPSARGDAPGPGGEALRELLEALARDGDGVDLDDAHAGIVSAQRREQVDGVAVGIVDDRVALAPERVPRRLVALAAMGATRTTPADAAAHAPPTMPSGNPVAVPVAPVQAAMEELVTALGHPETTDAVYKLATHRHPQGPRRCQKGTGIGTEKPAGPGRLRQEAILIDLGYLE